MDLGLKDRVAVVTGASRGIGLRIARSFAREGARLAICARGKQALDRAAEELAEGGTEILAHVCDLAEPDAAAGLLAVVQDRWGEVHALVNNVGGNRRGQFTETTDQDWLDIFQLNFLSGLRTARAAVPLMRAAGGGSIVFISSLFGREKGGSGLSIYNTTKSAQISAAGIMALELAPDGIRVNCVAPGSIQFEGGSWDKRVKADPEGMKKFIAANLPLGRFGRAEEVADVVAFLSSNRASLITGATIAVDGAQGRSLI
ncbi:MAG: SDR family oxidoreductase [Gemmatimonadetes bacterium]|nr:SDR family oxidoreductase [Gemmatimonadota bacterium]